MLGFVVGRPVSLSRATGTKCCKSHSFPWELNAKQFASPTARTRIAVSRFAVGNSQSQPEERVASPRLPGALPDGVIEAAHLAADAAGKVIRNYFRSPLLKVENKSDESPVTVADREAENAMRAILQELFPEWAVLGEEGGRSAGEAGSSDGWSWVLDPIDGTKAFVTGKPTFGILIALLKEGVPVLGLIDQPIARERWIGGIGNPTTLNGEGVRVRKRAAAECTTGNILEDIFVNATTPDMFMGHEEVEFQRLAEKAKMVLYGSDCYAYGLLASGHLDLVAEADMKPWDYLALVPVVMEAGGCMTDWSGSPLTIDSDGTVLASSEKGIHTAALEALGRISTPSNP